MHFFKCCFEVFKNNILLFPFIFEEQILYPFVYEYAKTSYTLHAKSAYWSIFSVLSGYLSKKNYPTNPPLKFWGA
jgi:hypothetical protein